MAQSVLVKQQIPPALACKRGLQEPNLLWKTLTAMTGRNRKMKPTHHIHQHSLE